MTLSTTSNVTERSRILTLLQGGTPDRVPWFGDLSYWITALIARGELSEEFSQAVAQFPLYRELGVGFYLQGYWPFKADYDPSVEYVTTQEGDTRVDTYRTPVGTIQARHIYLPASYTMACIEHRVKTLEDLRVLRYLYEHVSFRPDYDEAQKRLSLLNDLGFVMCYLPKSPFMQLVTEDAGIETVVPLAMEAEDEMVKTLEVMEAKLDEAADLAIASPAECLMIPENLSSEVVGRSFFEKYMRRCQEKWVRRIAQSGKHSFIHIDGTLRGLLHEEGAVGFTVLEALTPSPVGDVPVSQWRELAGPQSILWGGLPGIYFTPLVSDAEFDRHVREVLEIMRSEPRYVLGVADQVPPDGLRKRIGRVAELVDEYGVYA